VKSSQSIISTRSRLLAVVQILLSTANSDHRSNCPMPSSRIPVLTDKSRLLEPFARYKAAKYLMIKGDLRQETSRTADLGWDTNLTQNDSMTHIGRGQSTRQIATRSVQSFLHRDQVISRVVMSASCLVTMSTVYGCDKQTDMTMKNTLLN